MAVLIIVFENHRRRPERPAIPADSSAQRQGRGIVRHVRRRLDRKRRHIRVAEKNLNRWTVGIAILWVLLIVSISLIAKTI